MDAMELELAREVKRVLKARRADWLERGRNEGRLAAYAELAVGRSPILKAVPEEQDDPHDAIAEAMVEHAHECKVSGEDPLPGIEALRALLDDPEALAAALQGGDVGEETVAKAVGLMVIRKAWSEQTHPRDDSGRFVSSGDIRSASRDPKRAEELRKTVTNPEQRAKLDAAIDSAVVPGREKVSKFSAPVLHHEEGTEHANLIHGAMVKAVKDGDKEAVQKWVAKAQKMAAVHWNEAKEKAKAQFLADYPDNPDAAQWAEGVGEHFDDAKEAIQDAYDSWGGTAEGMIDGVSEREEFEDEHANVLEKIKKAQDDVWNAIEEARNDLGGKEKGYKLGRYFKAWDSSAHPRGKNGHFISKDSIEEAKGDPEKAKALREQVKPEDAAKLDKQLGEAPKGPSVTQKRGEAKERGKAILGKLAKAADLRGKLTAEDLHALADHLSDPAVTVAHLREVRQAMRGNALRAGFGGASRKEEMVRALVGHARGHARGLDPNKGKATVNAAAAVKERNKRKKKYQDTVIAKVMEYGGIDPNSYALKGTFANMNEAVANGLPLSIFRKGGRGLDQIAQEMESAGHIRTPDDRHSTDHLLDLIRSRAHTLSADLSKKHESDLDEYYRNREEAERNSGHDPAEIAEVVRLGEEAGRDEGQTDPVEEHGEGFDPDSIGEYDNLDDSDIPEGVDDSFDFGNNLTEPEPSAKAPPKPTNPTNNATHDHTHDLAAIKPGDSAYVGGHLVRRMADGRYQLETKGKYSATDAAGANAAIQRTWANQSHEKTAIDNALSRHGSYAEPDPFADHKAGADAARRRAAIPEGARAVSVDDATRGRTGTIKRDENGAAHLVIDGGAEVKANDFEPLKEQHSWRVPEKEAEQVRGLFDEPDSAPATPPEPKTVQQIADEITARRKQQARPAGADDANPTDAEFEAASRPGKNLTPPATDPAIDMGGLLDQPANAVAPGSRTGEAVARAEGQQAKRTGVPEVPGQKIPTIDPDLAARSYEGIDKAKHPTRSAAEAAARGVEGAGVVNVGGKWLAVKPIATSPTVNTTATGSPSAGDFAKQIQGIADSHPRAWGGDKVYIADIWQEAQKKFPGMTREQFDQQLREAAQSGSLRLDPADIPQAHDPQLLHDSHVDRLGAPHHFVLGKNNPARAVEQISQQEHGRRLAEHWAKHGAPTPELDAHVAGLREKAKRTGVSDASPGSLPKSPPKWARDSYETKAAIDAHAKATGKEKEFIQTAMENAGMLAVDPKTGDVTGYEKDPPEDVNRRLAQALASSHRDAHDMGHPRGNIEAALEALGAEKIGEVGEPVSFDGALHDGPAGSFTGHSHQIVRPGWIHRGGNEGGGDKVLVKGKTEKK